MGTLVRCVVMGSRDFDDEDFIRSAMLRVWSDVTERGSKDILFQFVFPSEKGRDGVERAVRGVARTGFNILHRARQLKKSPASILLPVMMPVEWDVVSMQDIAPGRAHQEWSERRVAPNQVWNSDVLDYQVWSEFVLSQGGVPDPSFLSAPSHVITIEAGSPDGWVQGMHARVAERNDVALHEFKTRRVVVSR
jgi:hypothetical protein